MVKAKASAELAEDGSTTLVISITGLTNADQARAVMDAALPKLNASVLRTLKKMGHKLIEKGKLSVRP